MIVSALPLKLRDFGRAPKTVRLEHKSFKRKASNGSKVINLDARGESTFWASMIITSMAIYHSWRAGVNSREARVWRPLPIAAYVICSWRLCGIPGPANNAACGTLDWNDGVGRGCDSARSCRRRSFRRIRESAHSSGILKSSTATDAVTSTRMISAPHESGSLFTVNFEIMVHVCKRTVPSCAQSRIIFRARDRRLEASSRSRSNNERETCHKNTRNAATSQKRFGNRRRDRRPRRALSSCRITAGKCTWKMQSRRLKLLANLKGKNEVLFHAALTQWSRNDTLDDVPQDDCSNGSPAKQCAFRMRDSWQLSMCSQRQHSDTRSKCYPSNSQAYARAMQRSCNAPWAHQ